MKISSFLYRQRQRFIYHTTKDEIKKQIAEINRFGERIHIQKGSYYIKEIDFKIPNKKFDFIFTQFDLFISNKKRLGGKYIIDDNELLFKWDYHILNINSASVLFIINEILVSKCYQFRLPNEQKVSIIDIGMNVGIASLYFASLPYVNEIFSFEPFNLTFEFALKNLSLNPKLSTKIHPMKYGLGSKAQLIKSFFNNNNLGINSVVQKNQISDGPTFSDILEIKNASKEVNKILNDRPQDNFVIKLDAEGAEYKIIKDLFRHRLNSRIIGIIIEWHKNGPDEIENYLLKEDFKLYSSTLKQNTGLIYAFR